MLSEALAFSVLAAVAAAQGAAYAQCGGQGWKGATTCVSGYTCTYSNAYYSQCLPGSGPAPGSSTTKATAAPQTTTTLRTSTTSRAGGVTTTTKAGGVTTTATAGTPGNTAGNIFAGAQVYANPYYASEVSSLAVPSLTAPWNTKATAVANIGSFTWLDTRAKVPTMDTYLADIQAKNAAGASPPIIGAFVVYDLPDRDCAALASNGELSIANGGAALYQDYIDSIAAIVKKYPKVNIALVVEPDSLGNLVTNMNVAKCSNAAATYKSSITYAIKNLNFPNVAMYLDAGHAGWLGWPANIQPAADLFASIWKAAGSPAAVRGLATNVANYNSWSIATCPSYTQGNSNCDEKRYINALAPLLQQAGFPAHFITDTSRNGVQPTKQQAWGDWCNVIGTGFGNRPSANTGDALLDAFAWVKPGGECDGTSNTTAARYDSHCGLSDALQPAPEAGTWFQAYFQQLLVNANPAF